MAATKPKGKTTKTKLPKLVDSKGRALKDNEIGDNINKWIDSEFQEELRLTEILDINDRRQIRLATGVGDMDLFVEEFNNNFENSIKKDVKVPTKKKPKLRKVSQEWIQSYRPIK